MNFKLRTLFTLLALVSVHCQDEETSSSDSSTESSSSPLDVGQGPGKVANTDVSKYAGVYDFTYFVGKNATSAKATAQLSCSNITGFTLDFPAGQDVDLGKNFSSLPDQLDPVYNTKQSSWVVKELVLGKEFDMLKVNLFVDDDKDTLVCWAIKLVGKQIIVNLNPNNGSVCPTRFIPSTKTCQKNIAYLAGTCKSGPCTGDGSKARTENSNVTAAKVTGNSGVAALNSSSLLLSLFLLATSLFSFFSL